MNSGNFCSAETCEILDQILLWKIAYEFKKEKLLTYRDAGLIYLNNFYGHKVDFARKNAKYF